MTTSPEVSAAIIVAAAKLTEVMLKGDELGVNKPDLQTAAEKYQEALRAVRDAVQRNLLQ